MMNLIEYLMHKNRQHKLEQLVAIIHNPKTDTILDIGIQNGKYKDLDNYLERHYAFPQNITAVGIGNLDDARKRFPKVKIMTYNGRTLPFTDSKFDYTYSNAVIEHVGNRQQQISFISEMIRVCRYKAQFTTPNKEFILDLHTMIPIAHWFNDETRNKIYSKLGKGHRIGHVLNLLTKNDLKCILNALHTEYEIIDNDIFGITPTFTVTITKKGQFPVEIIQDKK